MPSWVIRKTLPTHDFGLGGTGAHGAAATNPHFLYWAGPHTRYPRAPSWVWLTGLCPQVAHFRTQAEAEAARRGRGGGGPRGGGPLGPHSRPRAAAAAAAHAFASSWKRTLSIRAVTVEDPSRRP